MKIVFEDAGFRDLLPLVYWRAVYELRCGRRSLLEKIQQQWGAASIILFCRPDLAELVRESTTCAVNPPLGATDDEIWLVNGRWLADGPLGDLPPNSCLMKGEALVAARLPGRVAGDLSPERLLADDAASAVAGGARRIEADEHIKLITFPWDLITHNRSELIREWSDPSKDAPIDEKTVHLLGRENIHIGPATTIKPGVVIDAEEGPVWIDEGVDISPNAVIQGPCCIGPGSKIQPNAIIRENVSIGKVCKVGGEVEDVIIHAYSNKQHHGFLGHAYICEWVNMAAGTCNSNLKNTYGQVKVSLDGHRTIDTGLMFVGLFLGDHSKVGLNVCFSTGAVVGTASSVFVSHYPPRFIPSFRWLTDRVQTDYDPHQGIKVAERAMARRKLALTDAQKARFLALPDIANRYERR